MNNYKAEDMTGIDEKFYKLYIGEDCGFDDIHVALDRLVSKLTGYYKKGVIILVDSHDAPAQRLFENISFLNPQANEKLMKSIDYLSKIITDMFHMVGEECQN
jgi:hypothetical protein